MRVAFSAPLPPSSLLRPSFDDRSEPAIAAFVLFRPTVEPPLSLVHFLGLGLGLGFVRRLGLGLPLRFRLRLRRRTRRRPTISLLPAAPTRPLPARRFSVFSVFSGARPSTTPIRTRYPPHTPPARRDTPSYTFLLRSLVAFSFFFTPRRRFF